MIVLHRLPDTNILETVATGQLDSADYDRIIPAAEAIVAEYGKIRWYFEMREFDGWTLPALWADLKFDLRHAGDYERIAFVGHPDWFESLAKLLEPFTSAEVAYFESAEQSRAREWIRQ